VEETGETSNEADAVQGLMSRITDFGQDNESTPKLMTQALI
jgi:hypothetical protein